MKRGDLVWWKPKAGSYGKHWGVILHLLSKDTAYIVSATSGHTANIADLSPTTIESVIRYDRRKWLKSAYVTRRDVRTAMELELTTRTRR